jgi:hypothetical protein
MAVYLLADASISHPNRVAKVSQLFHNLHPPVFCPQLQDAIRYVSVHDLIAYLNPGKQKLHGI